MGTRTPRRRHSGLAGVLTMLVLVAWLVPAATTSAAAPNVRLLSPTGITIDGSNSDWDRPLDFLVNMFEAGRPDKDILAKAYARYDCAREMMVVFVEAIPHWAIVPSNGDNYVKVSQTDKLVDGNSGNNGTPPDFAYIGATGWEASFHLAPGSYIGDGGLNIHAEVIPHDPVVHGGADRPPGERDHRLLGGPDADPDADPDPGPDRDSDADPGSTAPTDRRRPTDDHRPATTRTEPPTTPPPSRRRRHRPSRRRPHRPSPDDPTDRAADDPTDRAADHATDRRTDPAPTPDRVGGADRDDPADARTDGHRPSRRRRPDVPPRIIVGKLSDNGTPGDPTDDTLLPGSTFAFYRDDGDGVFEPEGDDAPRLAEVDSDTGFHVWTPPGPGRYWVQEIDSANGLRPGAAASRRLPADPSHRQLCRPADRAPVQPRRRRRQRRTPRRGGHRQPSPEASPT